MNRGPLFQRLPLLCNLGFSVIIVVIIVIIIIIIIIVALLRGFFLLFLSIALSIEENRNPIRREPKNTTTTTITITITIPTNNRTSEI